MLQDSGGIIGLSRNAADNSGSGFKATKCLYNTAARPDQETGKAYCRSAPVALLLFPGHAQNIAAQMTLRLAARLRASRLTFYVAAHIQILNVLTMTMHC